MDQYGGEDEYIGGAIGGARGGARKKMFKKKHCTPKKNDTCGSCLDKEIIFEIAKAINNMSHKNLTEIDLNQSPEDIHGDICHNIQNISQCNSEACWMKMTE